MISIDGLPNFLRVSGILQAPPITKSLAISHIVIIICKGLHVVGRYTDIAWDKNLLQTDLM